MRSMVRSVYHLSLPLHKKSHVHDCHQIILTAKGKADFCVNNKQFSATAGNIAIFSFVSEI